MDHRVLLPTKHQQIKVETQDKEVVAKFEDRRWVFPTEDCLLLPIANTTAELIAHYIGKRLVETKSDWAHPGVEKIIVGIDENQGQWGECELSLNG